MNTLVAASIKYQLCHLTGKLHIEHLRWGRGDKEILPKKRQSAYYDLIPISIAKRFKQDYEYNLVSDYNKKILDKRVHKRFQVTDFILEEVLVTGNSDVRTEFTVIVTLDAGEVDFTDKKEAKEWDSKIVDRLKSMEVTYKGTKYKGVEEPSVITLIKEKYEEIFTKSGLYRDFKKDKGITYRSIVAGIIGEESASKHLAEIRQLIK